MGGFECFDVAGRGGVPLIAARIAEMDIRTGYSRQLKDWCGVLSCSVRNG